MGCCGQKRTALRNTLAAVSPPAAARRPTDDAPTPRPTSPARAAPAPRPPAPTPSGARGVGGGTAPTGATVLLRYSETSPIVVSGPVSRRPYRFTREDPVQRVDAQDADALLRTRFFTRSP